jgi:xanthine dehydrogenase large subunit
MARFIGDETLPSGTLVAKVYTSPVASGYIDALDVSAARALPGVAAVLIASDIPGCNQIGDIIADESLLAFHHVRFIGKPIALILAENEAIAHQALQSIRCTILPATPTEQSEEAAASGDVIGLTRTLQKGDVNQAWPHCRTIVKGTITTGAQEHVYFETQRTLAIPDEDRLRIRSATQSPSACQHSIAKVLNLGMHQIDVEVHRLGGAFGGKEEQAKPWAVLAALGAWHTRRPVWLALTRQEDFLYTGKRHPYVAHYRLGLDDEQRILAYEVEFFQDGGAVADLSTAILERTLFHTTSAYAVPNALIRATSCRTNKPSNTAFRGFGAPQGIFAMHAALCDAAEHLGIPFEALQQQNLMQAGDWFPYGERLESQRLQAVLTTLESQYAINARRTALRAFNDTSPRYKKGGALTPICFGIAFTATHLNQADALVNIYRDGSVAIQCSAVEMGQGVYLKIRHAAAQTLGIPVAWVRIDSTTTQTTANMSPTAASTGSDLNGLAAMAACDAIRQRLRTLAASLLSVTEASVVFQGGHINSPESPSTLTWHSLINTAYFERVSLAAHAHYATPGVSYDKHHETGHPFAYYAFGATWVEATVDTLTGRYSIDHAFCVYDIGTSLSVTTDRGQIEGAFVQGMGLCTSEEIRWDEAGHLLTRSLASYKIPDIGAAPIIDVTLLPGGSNPYGPANSKAVGEPPLIGGLGAYFALRDALKAFSPDLRVPFTLPLTPEKVLMSLAREPVV